ncbi:hypothetical protein MTR_5g056945 [Medicago truncatula]|uniref:Uncharacterized protein n=1 Tax=Medicago truncatula TaxID=3880 RepID=A0A072UQ72_MEDTR|nr:hypothetical protein MTR_5g056945 [Medicago truncatula]
MASSSSVLETSTSMQEALVYEIKGRTMKFEEWDLKIQTENPLYFTSLAHHGCDIRSYYEFQGLMEYFKLLNGPTYKTIVRNLWVRAHVYDNKAAKVEEADKILIDPTIKRKSIADMGLEPFTVTEIRSSIMGIPIFISQEAIAFVLRRASDGSYKDGIGNSKTSPWNEVVNQSMFNNTKKGAYFYLSMENKMLLKIQNENLLPKGGGSDQPSLEQKIFLHYFITKAKANVPRYIFKHIMKELRESQEHNKCWVPYGRLISEILHQVGILKALQEVNFFSDEQLDTETGKFINGKTLRNMNLIGKNAYTKLSTDLKEYDVVMSQ